MAEQKAIKTFKVEFEVTEPDIELLIIISTAIKEYRDQLTYQEYKAAMGWINQKYIDLEPPKDENG
jgi:hypothetical protein